MELGLGLGLELGLGLGLALGSLVETGTGRRRSMAFICSMVAVPVRHRPPWSTRTSLLTRAASGRSENTS